MKRIFAFTTWAFIVSPFVALAFLAAQERLPLTPCTCTYPVTVHSCHDGDTVTMTISLGYGVALEKQVVRLAGFDAWELTRARKAVGEITDEELAKGKLAKAALEKLVSEAEAVYLQPDPAMDREAHGRLWGRMVIKQKGVDGLLDVAAYMKSHGYDRDVKGPIIKP